MAKSGDCIVVVVELLYAEWVRGDVSRDCAAPIVIFPDVSDEVNAVDIGF